MVTAACCSVNESQLSFARSSNYFLPNGKSLNHMNHSIKYFFSHQLSSKSDHRKQKEYHRMWIMAFGQNILKTCKHHYRFKETWVAQPPSSKNYTWPNTGGNKAPQKWNTIMSRWQGHCKNNCPFCFILKISTIVYISRLFMLLSVIISI